MEAEKSENAECSKRHNNKMREKIERVGNERHVDLITPLRTQGRETYFLSPLPIFLWCSGDRKYPQIDPVVSIGPHSLTARRAVLENTALNWDGIPG